MPAVTESSSSVDEFLTQHKNLQAMPESAIRILRMTRDPNCNSAQLLKLIEQDAALSARIMKAVNSSFYALQTKMTRLDRVVAFMGLRAVKEVTLSSSISGFCNDIALGSFSGRDLWDHCVGVAILARELAVRSQTMDSEDAFLAGMLHDVGLLLAAQSEIQKSRMVFQEAETHSAPFTKVEQKVYGFDHCELGERLSQNWNLPEYVTCVVRWHHQPEDAPEEYKRFCRHVFIADSICCEAKVGCPLTCGRQAISDQALEMARLTRQTLVDVAAKLPILLRLHFT
jgi:HD-like signal output (HDOD) protein